MKKNVMTQIGKKFLVFLLLFGMLGQYIPADFTLALASDKKYEASFVERLEDVIDTGDITQLFDSNVAFKLSDKIADDEEISVIISLDVINLMDAYEATDKTLSFKDYALSDAADVINEEINKEKAEILAKLDKKGVAYKLGETYNTVLSGFELIIEAGDFRDTCKSLGKGASAIVGEEYEPADADVVENTVTIYEETGIFDSSASGYDGSGMVVAVLDTGIDPNHTAFSTSNFTSNKLGLTYENVAAVMKDTTAYKQLAGITVDDVYINEKIPFGFDYADGDVDPYATHNNHGTHVSGVIVGKDDTITGVAPNAQLVSMKIFSDVMDTARTSWILSALEDCVVLGVDVINMSLGTSAGFSRESDEEIVNGVYDKIRDAGINMIVAASNSYSSSYGSEANGNLGLTSNPDTGTVGSPSTYEGVMSVASISGTKTPYMKYNDSIIYFIESTDAASEENDFLATLLGEEKTKEFEYVVIPGVGRSADYTGLDVKGKIALVRRGSNTFEEKAIIAQQQGAAGIIIYNNVSGDIKMNVADATLGAVSISQDDGEMLAAQGGGKLTISVEQTAGPFISDFSSWGPTPELGIKPEITAHGGNILSAVTGGSYDRLSGTSMACPNLAGVVVLLRQYVSENFPEIAKDNKATTAFIYQLLMSTADIALNKNGLPYAVRKQGAGLANLMNAIQTPGYLTTKDSDGNIMDKTKLELGDDPEKTGVYTLNFTINNIGDKNLTYTLGSYVMTEGVSDTKTNAGETTVTEEAYILDGAKVEITEVKGGTNRGKDITVKAGEAAEVTVTITLSDDDKKYLDESFENGMYVEGFLTLKAKSGSKIDLSVPYLAFYGDWTQAPLFDLDYYETDADERDDSIAVEDKVLADAYATRPIAGVTGDYVSYLGGYYFLQDPKDMIISADRKYNSLSNQEGSLHSLRYVWAGLLRNAEKVDVTITNKTTGEVVFETTDDLIRKSYGDGGPLRPSNIEVEFDVMDYNFANNTELMVKLDGYLAYGENGGKDTNEKNTFEFPITVDYEAPTIKGVNYYYEYDKTLKKNRLYAEVEIYDNHFSMSSQLGYVSMTEDENGNPTPGITTFEQYMTPIYSEKNITTKVKYELTDYIYDIKNNAINGNSFVLTVYDYALNYATYEIGLPDDFEKFYIDGLEEGLTMSPNEVFSLAPIVNPVTEWGELLEFDSSRPGVVRVVNNKLVAVSSGKAIVRVQNAKTNESFTFNVTVLKEGDEGYRKYDKPVADVFALNSFYTQKAYYMLNSSDKEIGDSGTTNFFEGRYDLSLYPSEAVYLIAKLDAYFPNVTKLEFETSNDAIVKVDASGLVTAVSEGFASVTVKVTMDGKSTYFSETVSIEVKNPYIQTGSSLTHYYGNGGLVTIPADLSLKEIGTFAFSNFDYIEKTAEELAFDDAETSKQWYIGDNTITKVVIPEGVEKIGAYAFANLTALEEVVFPSTLEHIDYGAFYGCTSLKKISFSGENNLKLINSNAFENCNLSGKLDLSAACIVANYAFAGNKNLEGFVTGDNLVSIGSYAFAGCKKLTDVTITADRVKYGTYAFTDCESLKEFTVNAAVLPEGMFYQCDALEKVIIGKDVNDIGAFAFRETGLTAFEVEAGNKAYKVVNGNIVVSADGKSLVAVAPTITGEFTTANLGDSDVTAVAKGAFSHNLKLTSVSLPNVTEIADYGFASGKNLVSVSLGALTKLGEYAFFETGITALPNISLETELGKYAFSYTDLQTVNVPDKMVLPEGIFSECKKLASVTIGDDVTIGKFAFSTNKDESFTIKNYDEDGEKYFYYDFATALKELTIGKNATIGENAFAGAASLEKVTLGEGATIAYMAFYNNNSLKDIDLSKVTSIGNYAFSGDVYNIYLDENMSYMAVSKDGNYMYTYHAPNLVNVDLSSATEIGEYAFAYCQEMESMKLGEAIKEIPQYTFAGCESLENINMEKVEIIGDYAFMESGLKAVNLSAAKEIGKYAFLNSKKLEAVTLNSEGTDVKEGAFAYAEALAAVENLAAVKNVGDWSFSYTAIVKADLSGAEYIGTQAFIKEKDTPFEVILGDKIESLGDNPFARCVIAPFSIMGKTEINEIEVEIPVSTYDITDTVKVVDGSLYSKVPNGWELIIYTGNNTEDVKVAEDTVRITSMAFAGTGVKMVTLPNTVGAIGHKAFYECADLTTVVFGSYYAPIMEEEYDPAYYNSLEHIPGSGDYGTYTDWSGNEVPIESMGLIPYFMWNVTNGMFSNVFYGANFVDYVGYVENKLLMVRPVNGENYDTFIMDQYFDLVIDGPAAPDTVTMTAINAIKAIPSRVALSDKALVEYARASYDKIATTEQQALVVNYADLVTAEQRLVALESEEEDKDQDVSTEPSVAFDMTGLLVIILVAVLVCGATVAVLHFNVQIKAFIAQLLNKAKAKKAAGGDTIAVIEAVEAVEEPVTEEVESEEESEEVNDEN